MKIIKKYQLLLYVLVLILMIAGYLNYTGDTKKQLSLETAMQLEQNDGNEVSDIGDAKLVNSQDVTSENNLASDNTSQSNETDKESKTNTVENDTIQTMKKVQIILLSLD